jgi:DNA-binding CsgD family transcriptional regulator
VSRRSIGIPCNTQANVDKNDGMTRLEAIAQRRAVPGVVLFSGTGDVLFMNREAELLIRQMSGKTQDESTTTPLPKEIQDLCASLQTILEKPETRHGDTETHEGPIELRRIIGEGAGPVLLRGFPLAAHPEKEDACMLVLMEKIGRERRVVPDQVKQQYRLTDREVEIVRYISDGWTNKEIAQHLDISEHTVKEHVRHLLKKTKTTTRTGILAQIFQDT